jgi:hypothetical protein
LRCANHLKAAFSGGKLVDITADAIEDYLRRRLRQRVRVKVAQGYREKGILKRHDGDFELETLLQAIQKMIHSHK